MTTLKECCSLKFYENGSDIWFGDFNEDDCFRIEKSKIYQLIKTYGIKSIEFILSRLAVDTHADNKILFIEAKKSLQKQDYIDISQKFMDSLQLSSAISLGIHKKRAVLPKNIACFFEQGGQIIFILVVKDCGKEKTQQLKNMEEAIKRQLLKEYKIWKFIVRAIKEETAKNENIVTLDENSAIDNCTI